MCVRLTAPISVVSIGSPQCLSHLPHDPSLNPRVNLSVSLIPPVNASSSYYDGLSFSLFRSVSDRRLIPRHRPRVYPYGFEHPDPLYRAIPSLAPLVCVCPRTSSQEQVRVHRCVALLELDNWSPPLVFPNLQELMIRRCSSLFRIVVLERLESSKWTRRLG